MNAKIKQGQGLEQRGLAAVIRPNQAIKRLQFGVKRFPSLKVLNVDFSN